MKKEFKVLSDIYTLPDENGVQKVIKKNIVTKVLLDTEDIKYPEEIFNSKGVVLKGVCMIKLQDGEIKKLKHKYEEIKSLIATNETPTKIKGFFRK